jgi:misacylated tRNA(Ala) deacylase
MSTELLFRDDAYAKTASARVVAVDERGIELDRTIFYPLGGGQPGDTGTLTRTSGERIAIVDARKGEGVDSVVHVPDAAAPRPEVGETLALAIDWDRRYALMRLHTALHVMSCVVIAPVTGGNIAPDKARLLFANPASADRRHRIGDKHRPSGTGFLRVEAFSGGLGHHLCE